MFQLSGEEVAALRSQCATSKTGRGGRRYAPYAFTEHGAIMLASVLNTVRAVEVSVHVVRAFVRLREMMSAKPVPRRVHARNAGWQRRNQYGVPGIAVDCRGVHRFEITICDLKRSHRVRGSTVPAVCLYRAGCRHVIECSPPPAGYSGERGDHASVRPKPRSRAGRGRCPWRVDENLNPRSWNSEGLHAQRCPVPFYCRR